MLRSVMAAKKNHINLKPMSCQQKKNSLFIPFKAYRKLSLKKVFKGFHVVIHFNLKNLSEAVEGYYGIFVGIT